MKVKWDLDQLKKKIEMMPNFKFIMCTERMIQHLIKELTSSHIQFLAKVVNEEKDIKSRVESS